MYLFYLLVVPSDFHTPQNLEEEDFDQTDEFIRECAKDNFNIETTQKGNELFFISFQFMVPIDANFPELIIIHGQIISSIFSDLCNFVAAKFNMN